MSSLILPTKTPEETRDAIIEWLKCEAGFHQASGRFCKGKRAKEAREAEAHLIYSLAESLAKYRTPAEVARPPVSVPAVREGR
jgi:hypothetical protein